MSREMILLRLIARRRRNRFDEHTTAQREHYRLQ